MITQHDFLAIRLMFCALVLGDNLDVESDREVLHAAIEPSHSETLAWVTNIAVGEKRESGWARRGSILSMKECP